MGKKDITSSILAIIFIMVVIAAFSKRPSLGIIVFSGGILMIIGWAVAVVRKIKKGGEEATGNLVDIEYDTDGDPNAIIEFKTQSGQTIRGKPFISTNMNINGIRIANKQPDTGLRVIYYRKDPSKFILPEYSFNNSMALIFGSIIVLVMLSAGLYDIFIKAIF